MVTRWAPAVLTAAYVVLIAMLTLWPSRIVDHPAGPLWVLFSLVSGMGWLTFDRFEFSANVAMFTPLGVLLTWLLGRRRCWYALLAGLALTVVIEVAQRGIPGRVSDPRDVAANTIGTALGVVLALAVEALVTRHRSRSAESSRQGDV